MAQTRKATIEDIEEIQRIAKVTWNHTYDGLIPEEIQQQFLAQNYSDDVMKRRLERSILFVAVVDNKVVGFANFFRKHNEKEAELGSIYVYPDQHGKGIGTKLLKTGIFELNGMANIFVNVEHQNTSGMNFYVAKGFKVVKEFEEDLAGTKVKMVRMVLQL